MSDMIVDYRLELDTLIIGRNMVNKIACDYVNR